MNYLLLGSIQYKIAQIEMTQCIEISGIIMNEEDLEELKYKTKLINPSIEFEDGQPLYIFNKRIYLFEELKPGEFKLII